MNLEIKKEKKTDVVLEQECCWTEIKICMQEPVKTYVGN